MECVALLAGGVDRNNYRLGSWGLGVLVALLAGGVDRNSKNTGLFLTDFRRPPRGGRG